MYSCNLKLKIHYLSKKAGHFYAPKEPNYVVPLQLYMSCFLFSCILGHDIIQTLLYCMKILYNRSNLHYICQLRFVNKIEIPFPLQNLTILCHTIMKNFILKFRPWDIFFVLCMYWTHIYLSTKWPFMLSERLQSHCFVFCGYRIVNLKEFSYTQPV